MSTLRRSPLVLCAIVLALPLLTVFSGPAQAAPDGNPHLGLRAASPSVELVRYGRGPVWLDLGVSVISKDAPFELRVRRETYDDPLRVRPALPGSGGVGEGGAPGG